MCFSLNACWEFPVKRAPSSSLDTRTPALEAIQEEGAKKEAMKGVEASKEAVAPQKEEEEEEEEVAPQEVEEEVQGALGSGTCVVELGFEVVRFGCDGGRMEVGRLDVGSHEDVLVRVA